MSILYTESSVLIGNYFGAFWFIKLIQHTCVNANTCVYEKLLVVKSDQVYNRALGLLYSALQVRMQCIPFKQTLITYCLSYVKQIIMKRFFNRSAKRAYNSS